MNALKADARTVDLRSLAPHFYSLGARILDIFEDDELVDVLSDVRSPPLATFSNRDRASRSGQRRLPIWRITPEARWEMAPTSYGGWMRRSEDVGCPKSDWIRADILVFRMAHDDSKSVRSWIAEVDKA